MWDTTEIIETVWLGLLAIGSVVDLLLRIENEKKRSRKQGGDP